MPILELSIDDIIINPSNDRHGPTSNEAEAINWLFEKKSSEMTNLAKRIVEDGRIFDVPLVVPKGQKFLLKDGNRRVTCLKLIHDPSAAPKKFGPFFESLNKIMPSSLAKVIDCQVENDVLIADQIIGLRHNGKQGGIGQLKWGTIEKANHANRISGKSDYEWPQLVEKALLKAGHPAEASMIKRSTLDRVLKTQKRREALGIELNQEGQIVSSDPNGSAIPLLRKLARDMDGKRLTLKNTLVATDIDVYLDDLKSKGFGPEVQRPSHKSPPQKKPSVPPKIRKEAPRNSRKTMIPQNIEYDFNWVEGQGKLNLAFDQLRYELLFEQHKYSIAVVFRTLLEMTATKFLDKIGGSKQESLIKSVGKVCDELASSGLLAAKDCQDLKRIANDESSTLSIKHLQRIVHSTTAIPSDDDLRSMWECYEPMIVAAIQYCQDKPK